MAVKTFTLTDTNDTVNATGCALLADGVDQTAANRTAGKWTVAKVAAANSSYYNASSNAASASFNPESTTAKPNTFTTGECFRGPNTLTGTFAATAWTFTFAVRASVASSQAGRVRTRVWKSTDVFGTTGLTQLTSAVLVGTTSAALSTTADVTTVVTWSPGALTLTSEYLWFDLAWEITTASGSNSGDVIFRLGQSAGGTRIVTPDLSAGAAIYTKAGYAKENG